MTISTSQITRALQRSILDGTLAPGKRLPSQCLSTTTVLIRGLSRAFGKDVEIGGAASGLHLVAWLPRLSMTQVETLTR